MALYILEDKSLHPFLSKRTSQEISAVKSLNQRRIPTRSITDMTDLSVLLSDSESIFLFPIQSARILFRRLNFAT